MHFSVLVIGDDVERQLAPYHEYEVTGVRDEYVIDADITEEMEAYYETGLRALVDQDTGKTVYRTYKETMSFLEFICYEYDVAQEEYLLTESELKNYVSGTKKYVIVVDDNDRNKVLKVLKYTNPNAKWDYWLIGGGWNDVLRTHNGEPVSQSAKKDINWASVDLNRINTVFKDSQWYARPSEVTSSEWRVKVKELLADVPDDTLFTVVDCHI